MENISKFLYYLLMVVTFVLQIGSVVGSVLSFSAGHFGMGVVCLVFTVILSYFVIYDIKTLIKANDK